MELIKVTAFLSCMIVMVNGVAILFEHVGSEKMRVKRDPPDVATTKPATVLSEISFAGREAAVPEAKEVGNDEFKEIDKVDGEEKHLSIIKKPFKAIASIFKKKPEPQYYNYANGNHYSSYHSSDQLNNAQTVQIPDHNTPINPQIDIYNKPQNGALNQHPHAPLQIYPLQTGSISSFPNQHQVAHNGGFVQNPHSPGHVYPLQSTSVSSTPNHPSQNIHNQNIPHQHNQYHHTSNTPQAVGYQKPYVGDFIPIKTKPQTSQKPDFHDIILFPEEPHAPSRPHHTYFGQDFTNQNTHAQEHHSGSNGYKSENNGSKSGQDSKFQKPIEPNHQLGSSPHDHYHGSAHWENKPHQSNNKPSFWPSESGHQTNTNHGPSHGSNFQITTVSGTKPQQASNLFQKPSSSGSNFQSNNKPPTGSSFQKPYKPEGGYQSQKLQFGILNKPQGSVFDKPSNGPVWYPGQGTTQQFFGPTYQNPYNSYEPQFGYQGFHHNPWANNYNQYQSQTQPAYHPQYDPYTGYVQQTKPDAYYDNQKPFPSKKPLITQTSFQGHTTLTRKQFLSLFKPIMALASVLKKPIILEPVVNEVLALQPHGSNYGEYFGNFVPQQGQYPGKPFKPSNQGYQPYNKPDENHPHFLKPQSGSWEMIRGNVGSLAAGSLGMAFGPIGPIISSFSRPYLSQAVHELSGGYLAKDTGLNMEPERAPFYMIDDEDESQRQEYPVFLPAELLNDVSIADDGEDNGSAYSTESRTVVQPNTDVSAGGSIESQQSTGDVTVGSVQMKDGSSVKEDTMDVNNTVLELKSAEIVQLVDVKPEVQDKELSEISPKAIKTNTGTSNEAMEQAVETKKSLIKFGLD